MEISSVESYAGTDPGRIDPVLEQLIRNLAPGQRPVLRLGGDTTDWTWWPTGGIRRPPGVSYTLSKRWLQVSHALVAALDARLILGINLEANSPQVASAEARAMIQGIGQRWIDALELGNEPELYGALPWFEAGSIKMPGRRRGYDFGMYVRDYSHVASSLPHLALAGPSTGSPNWMSDLRRFVADEPRVRVLTLHRYPLAHCVPQHVVTIAELLSNASARGLASSVAGYARFAHAHGLRLRIDEINAVSCGGQKGVSDTFASALWALDALFEIARSGVDGVNFHTHPRAIGELFSIRDTGLGWQAAVHPEYYGMMMFAQAAPPGSRLLRISGTTHGPVRAWATAGTDRHLRVVLINTSTTLERVVLVRASAAVGSGTLERLQAPSAGATDQASLAGQSFGPETGTGLLAGTPQLSFLTPHAGNYTIGLPPASAAMLTLPTH